jgi:hypothetical protein
LTTEFETVNLGDIAEEVVDVHSAEINTNRPTLDTKSLPTEINTSQADATSSLASCLDCLSPGYFCSLLDEIQASIPQSEPASILLPNFASRTYTLHARMDDSTPMAEHPNYVSSKAGFQAQPVYLSSFLKHPKRPSPKTKRVSSKNDVTQKKTRGTKKNAPPTIPESCYLSPRGQHSQPIDSSQTPLPREEEKANMIRPDYEPVFPGADPIDELRTKLA